MSEIAPLIQRLDTWLQQNCADYYASLGRGATEEQISQFEEDTQISLPAELAEVYRWKNGANDLIPGKLWMPLELAVEMWTWWQEFEPLQPWHPDFIPFMENGGGDYYCLDPIGIWQGVPGQVIYVFHDDRSSIVAPSLASWLEVIVQCHESGCWIREQNQEFSDFAQSDGWSETYYRLTKSVLSGYPRYEV